MKNTYSMQVDPNMGFGESHVWMKFTTNFTRWYVCGLNAWALSGYAVVDDFGTLVEVAQ